MTEYYAHTPNEKGEWHSLEDHLISVAECAQTFAHKFGAGDFAFWVGLWHDLGKYSAEFQEYLERQKDPNAHLEASSGRDRDHSSAGAQHATKIIEIIGHLLAYAIAGHHAGLLNGRDTGTCQEARLKKGVYPWQQGLSCLPSFTNIELPMFLRNALAQHDAFTVAFLVRMCFSCLVDADFLDTESHMRSSQAKLRAQWPKNILIEMEKSLNTFVENLKPKGSVLVNQQRAMVRQACLKAAKEKSGLFSLTVPTGGGKTLASLAFALRHAIRNNLERVIYVIPLTSIIEQNAEVFREALKAISDSIGLDVVLEHHSSLDPEKETAVNRLAAENWDAPLIVTTSVQFYESLFANKTSRCRKLHRLARSVIILDEAQTLPVDYLQPCLRVLKELTANYGASIVICTATQPAIEWREGFEIGLQKPLEIMPNPTDLYNQLQRVHVDDIGSKTDEEICRSLSAEPQVLCIVNTKPHARKLFEALGSEEGQFHLSGNMCPAHRSEILKKIRANLDKGKVCRVVSTQVIEAGVDVDFPVVYRSLAGLDSIAQAAGRCNRNGKPEKGRTHIFRSENVKAERFFADTAQCAGQVLPLHDDPLDLKAVDHYFRLYYWEQKDRWDEKKIMDNFHLNRNDRGFPFSFGFKSVAESFQLIDDAGSQPIIIPWQEDGRILCEHLRNMPAPTLEIRRKLQRYVVQIPMWLLERHAGRDIQLVHNEIWVLASPEIHYSEDTGLNLGALGPGAIFG